MSSNMIVFAGPSIRKEKILETLPEADIRPPAKQGDVYLATRDKPQVILLIDGFFESVPAVWHKEVLYAMSNGIHVYGSSSMGALRAAELVPFGMVGVGDIFENYANLTFEDDDEVALTHGPAELGFMPISRAMADLRHDLICAKNKGILTEEHAQAIETHLKSLWYPERNHAALITFANTLLDSRTLTLLESFLKNEAVSLKEQDAEQLIRLAADIDLAHLAPKKVDYTLQENDAWQTLINDVSPTRATRIEVDLPENHSDSIDIDDPLAKFDATLRARALEHAVAIGIEFKPWVRPAFHKVVTKWGCVAEDGQIDFAKVSQKMLALGLSTQQFDRWIEREAMLLAYAYQVEVGNEHIIDATLFAAGESV
ncbi:TfuA-like protein [Marinomonas mediterranea]|uniref:TfuA-like protein n=1 Tax=Marinomonas mediterranea TaxID=119864 RepID=UPI002349EDD5|nr:TfuA-like protein [Marinomonas mediterranea]WCN09539.1 hypothetical protein GV055_11690 [Marinomonas mediterranea]